MEHPKDVTNKPCPDCAYLYALTDKEESWWMCERCGYQYISANKTDNKQEYKKLGMGAVLLITEDGKIQNATYDNIKFFDELKMMLSENPHITKCFFSHFRTAEQKFYWVNWFTKEEVEFPDDAYINNKDGTFFSIEEKPKTEKEK